MDNNSPNTPQGSEQLPQFDSDRGISDPATAPAPYTPPVRSSRGGRLVIAGLAAALVVLGVAGYYYYQMLQSAKETLSPAPTRQTSGVPDRLLRANGNVGGVSVGYLRVGQAVSDLQSKTTAYADVPGYVSALFYTKNDGALPQIYYYDTAAKTELKVTSSDHGVSTPVFSSLAQKVAYIRYTAEDTARKAPDNSTCDLEVRTLWVDKPVTVQKAEPSHCYTPIEWSPDGSKLLYAGVNNTLTADDWGLLRLYVYDGTSTTALKVPEGYNSLDTFSNAWWKNASSVTAHFIHKIAGGNSDKQAYYTLTVASGEASPLNALFTTSSKPQLLSETVYFIGTGVLGGKIAAVDGTTGGSARILTPEPASSFLLRTDAAGIRAKELIYTTGQAGSENSFRINRVPLDGYKKTELAAPKGFSVYLLGWQGDFDHVLYMTVVSGASEVHSFNLSDKTDTALITGLALVQ